MLSNSLCSAILAFTSCFVSTSPQDVPPGVVLVKGGRTKVGSPVKLIEELIPKNLQQKSALAAETPQHTVDIEDFYLMPTEVTNEQYAKFVKATGAKPPWYWGRKTDVDAARDAFLKADAERRAAALKEGIRLERARFEQERWWEENWKDLEWEVPTERLARPVTNVTYYDAVAYAEWAGLRLMTEFEYFRAALGDEDWLYPWGNDFDKTKVASNLSDRNEDWPVGKFGASASGICDLVGNVWEWTSSSYTKFPKYKPIQIKDGKGRSGRTIEALAGFDPNYRVAVGGSYSNGEVGVRVATRFGAVRSQATQALGFRCAADVTPGRTVAQTVLDNDVKLSALPPETEFYIEEPLVLQRWNVPASQAEINVPNYAVIDGYERILFFPAMQVNGANTNDFEKKTAAEGPAILGVLATTEPIVEPALPPGTYYVGWRGAGKLKEAAPEQDDTNSQEDAAALVEATQGIADFAKTPGFGDPEEAHFFFFQADGTPVAAVSQRVANGAMEYERIKESGKVGVVPFKPPTPDELKKMEKNGIEPPKPLDTLHYRMVVAGRAKSKGFYINLDLKIGQDRWN